ncbi:CLK4-associating serine/arginine rich protein [Taenia crassiceps]|uniref:CLK4-associating serine/arginine rich protein n=1 Tax=Taenia crassiceps TaxID=6207 RepID=A0ABR4Q765_9CEST
MTETERFHFTVCPNVAGGAEAREAHPRQDPIKFLRVYGSQAKINLDVEVRKAAENPKNMMPWTADSSILIDRFDARANLETYSSTKPTEIKLSIEEKIEERLCNYERYRCLAHNDFLGVTESMALKQIEREEKYGDTLTKKHEEDSKDKKPLEPKAAIGFVYEEGEIVAGKPSIPSQSKKANAGSDSEPSDVDSDADIDVELDLDSLDAEQRLELIEHSHAYGMKRSDFIRLLDADQVLETELRMAKILEEEKSQHLRRPRRRHQPRMRQPFDKYSPAVQGPKVGLLNGQPITRRKVYLSGASSDSESYGSPSSEDEDRGGRSRNFNSGKTATQLARTKPALFESKRPAVLIGGLTLVAFCDPKKRRRRSRDRPRRRQRSSRSKSRSSSSEGSRDSSSDSSRRGRHSHRNRSSKRSKVEYITTFGNEDEDDELTERRDFPLSHIPGMAAGRPSDAASKVAASVVSSLFKDSSAAATAASISHKKTLDSARMKPAVPAPISSSSVQSRSLAVRDRRFPSYRRRRSSSSSSTAKRRSRRHSSTRSSSSPSRSGSTAKKAGVSTSRNRSPSRRSGDGAEAVPIKRYYRRELESDEEKKMALSSSASSASASMSDTEGDRRPLSPASASRNRSPFVESDGRRRYFDNLGEAGDLFSGGKGTASPSQHHHQQQHSVDRYSNPPNPHTSSTSSKDIRTSLNKPALPAAPKLTPQEIMKRRMQAQLNKTMNAEKKAELERLEKQERERMDREEGLRKLAAQMRQREIEKRLAERGFRHQLPSHHSSTGAASSSRRSASSSTTSRSCSPTSPVIPPALRRASPSQFSTVNLEISPGGPSRARLRRPPSPFRRRDYQNRYGGGILRIPMSLALSLLKVVELLSVAIIWEFELGLDRLLFHFTRVSSLPIFNNFAGESYSWSCRVTPDLARLTRGNALLGLQDLREILLTPDPYFFDSISSIDYWNLLCVG